MATRATETLAGQPSLTECHCCHLRPNFASSNLHILPSEWRLVILCNNCLLGVESAALCPYCFSTDDADWFSCPQCKRRVHRACDCELRRSGSAADVSASAAAVCGDCWFPESLATWRRKLQNMRNGKTSEVDLGIDKSRVSTLVHQEEIGDGVLGLKEGEASSSNAVVNKEAPPQKESVFMDRNRGGGGIDFFHFKYSRRRRAYLFGLKYKRRSTTGGHSVDIQAEVNADGSEFREVV